MPLEKIRLRIDAPTEHDNAGRGFYQVEEDCLYVHLGMPDQSHRFFSYLESDSVRLDMDKHGRLVFIEVNVARHRWEVDQTLREPRSAPTTDIRWLDFRQRIKEPVLSSNEVRTMLKIDFLDSESCHTYQLSETVFVEVDDSQFLKSLTVVGIIDDSAGRKIARYRKELLESEVRD